MTLLQDIEGMNMAPKATLEEIAQLLTNCAKTHGDCQVHVNRITGDLHLSDPTGYLGYLDLSSLEDYSR